MSKNSKRTALCLSLAAALAATSPAVLGGGFALLEQSGSGMGNAYAGTAASVEDASTVFWNPAGMSLLPGPQIVVAGHAINVDTGFSGSGTPALIVGTDEGGQIGDLALVPNAYFAMPLGERLAIGVGVNVPFGLVTEYDEEWLGRFQGIKSELKTINVNPSLAYKLSDTVSLGVGVNWQHAEAELTNALFTGGPEARVRLDAEDDAFGWNVGALFQLGPDMRVGVAYRSTIDYTLDGDVSTVFAASGAPVPGGNFPAEAEVTFPDSFTVSVLQRFGEKWELLGDIQYTRWSEIDNVNIINTATGVQADQLVFDFDDAWRVALGLNYHSSEKWTFKTGIAYDQSPVDDDNRTVRLPDTDRIWVALGAKYRFGKNSAIDIGYAHLFVDDADINTTRTHPGGFVTTVTGDYDSQIDIVSVQLTWTF